MTSEEDRLADLLERWEAAASSGSRPTPEEICRDSPVDLPAFRKLLRQLGLAGMMTATGQRSSRADGAGFRAGRYTAIEYHATSRLGIVYRANDEELNRVVALKCMRSAAPIDSPAGGRFMLEAEVTSQLEHPGIAPVHGRGQTDDGRPYFAMRFIDGETLQDATRRFHAPAGIDAGARNVERRRLLRALVGVCETVAYAHSRGVIHRDLRPSNIMVGPFGEVLVMDWGLAKQVRSEELGVRSGDLPCTPYSSLLTPHSIADTPQVDPTDFGMAKGSPAFMSPEQARGEWDRLGPASDIFSLGSTLFYVLTGRVPYDGKTNAEVVAKIRDGVLAPPGSISGEVIAALAAICRKAMALLPANRYPTAKALAEDVERWLADEPVSAWREPLTHRASRWGRRHRAIFTATVAALVIGLILLAIYSYRLGRNSADEQAARTMWRD
jgi:serine/threonine protein kinase